MSTKMELAKQLEAAMGTASIDGAKYYASHSKAWLVEQLRLNAWYEAVKATFNPALNVQLATNAEGHPLHHVCGVCLSWIGHRGQLWAFRLNQTKIDIARPRHQPTRCDWHLIDAFCIDCAAK